jgi:hypothetical protein
MKKIAFLLFLLCSSCQQKSSLSTEFSCTSTAINNLEEVVDVKKIFSVQFPKDWKTNLYYDTMQSSIYTADTTKQLTETTLLDVTYIKKSIALNDIFKLENEQENLANGLIQIQSKDITLFNKPAYYAVSKGKKRGFAYQVCNLFIKINEEHFIHTKAEFYGDSFVYERLCTAIYLIEKIKIQH